ncbi:MAG: exported protein of unknown function [Candidatus Saccharibacteria bacterium]|nr:exported protein of unknown function [Candidatus Saccharibacteria bacterium]
MPIILGLIIAGLIIAALISLGRTIFGGGGGGSSPSPSASPQVNAGKQALTSTLTDRSVQMTVRGPIVADESFHSYTITITPTTRNITTYVGYIGQSVDNNQLTNNTQAYEQLVYSLDRAKLMDGTPLSDGANDERGVCATGTVYEFEVLQGTNAIQKLWTSTCVGSLGSLKANLGQVTNLFEQQIPTFRALLQKINLNS